MTVRVSFGSKPAHPAERSLRPLDLRQPTYPPCRRDEFTVPTLVLHCREDGRVPFDQGRKMAELVPGSRFVPLEGRNHLMLENEPAWLRFKEEVSEFLAE